MSFYIPAYTDYPIDNDRNDVKINIPEPRSDSKKILTEEDCDLSDIFGHLVD